MKLGAVVYCVILSMHVGIVPACPPQEDWIALFDGKTLNGWAASENKDSFRIEDGSIVCDGPRSHLFYSGPVEEGTFRNFELALEVKTAPASNSGIFFHTEYQELGYPLKGYEAQVLNVRPSVAEGEYQEGKMTGSLSGVRNLGKSPVSDGKWFRYHILVQGKTIRIRINDELVVDYTEPASPYRVERRKARRLSSGTFALQCHDPASRVRYRGIRVRPLPDDLPPPGQPPENLEWNARFVELASNNFPLMDLHVHLKRGLKMQQALANSRKYGITYGIAVNCGMDMTLPSEEALGEFLDQYEKPPQTYLAMQAEGREWLDLFSEEAIERFDYVFTDAMTWTNDAGKRMRLWIKEEVEVGDPEHFMDTLVERIEGILAREPIDIYVNPTYLPDEINARYAELWTPERMDRVIRGLVRNGIALEINAARRIPSPAFIQRAKAAGVKFTFGTNNSGADDLGQLEYCLEMIDQCGLEPTDIWIP
jgi:hypothetical protein